MQTRLRLQYLGHRALRPAVARQRVVQAGVTRRHRLQAGAAQLAGTPDVGIGQGIWQNRA